MYSPLKKTNTTISMPYNPYSPLNKSTITQKKPISSSNLSKKYQSNKSLQKTSRTVNENKTINRLNFTISRQNFNRNNIKTQRSISEKKKIVSLNKKHQSISWKDITTRKSTHIHKPIQAYGISSTKGQNNILNKHQIGVYLGNTMKHFMLIQAYNGTFAASWVKNQLPLQLLKRFQQNQSRKICQDPGKTINNAFYTIQTKLSQQQVKNKDISGCSIIGITIKQDLIIVSNCGISQAFCFTKLNSLISMNSTHDTQNQNQIGRIIQEGAKLYRTTINLPYKKQLSLTGPIRIYPSGLTFTRLLGYPATQLNSQKIIISTPQIKYVNIKDIQWLAIVSYSLAQVLSNQLQSLINQEYQNLSLTYTLHDIAGAISNKLIYQATILGAKGSLTAIIIFISMKQYSGEKQQQSLPTEKITKGLKKTSEINNNNKSLQYIGTRKSFYKNT